jgi:hypothetical protein
MDDRIDIAALVLVSRLRESEGWTEMESEDPLHFLQRRADDASEGWAKQDGPRLVPEGAIEEYREVRADLRQRLIRLLVDCPELENAKGRRYRFTWRVTKWQSKGMPVWGSSKPIPQPQREKFDIAESWEVILSLPVWLLLDDDGKNRLLHHELMHAATASRGHAVEEWPETVARFGLGQKTQALLALAGVAHRSTFERIETWGLLPNGQVTFLPTVGIETIEVRVPA